MINLFITVHDRCLPPHLLEAWQISKEKKKLKWKKRLWQLTGLGKGLKGRESKFNSSFLRKKGLVCFCWGQIGSNTLTLLKTVSYCYSNCSVSIEYKSTLLCNWCLGQNYQITMYCRNPFRNANRIKTQCIFAWGWIEFQNKQSKILTSNSLGCVSPWNWAVLHMLLNSSSATKWSF